MLHPAQSVFRHCFALRHWRAALITIAALCGAAPIAAGAAPSSTSAAAPAYTGQIIVRWRDGTTSTVTSKEPAASAASAASPLQQLRERTGIAATLRRPMGGNMDLLQVPDELAADPEAAAARLRQDPRVADAVPDRWLRLHDTVPNDPEFRANQPYLLGTGTTVGGVNLPRAWDRTRGSGGIVIAVVDTGVLQHPDLAARLLQGYDFISSAAVSNDGDDGRDGDSTDPGDNVPSGFTCPGSSSPTTEATANSWHGTRVASVLGAVTNNGEGIAGVDWSARVLPVRVSGRCGALLSDTVDGMRWAGGLSVPNVPANPNPARVVNISLGGGTCSSIEQQAVNDLNARGVVVVAAAGNNRSAVEAPADCRGVIAVTAHANDGENATYANVGPQVAISAPGGGCGNSRVQNGACTTTPSVIRTLSNNGGTSIGDYTVSSSQGTSFAAPMVSGVVAMMFALNGSLSPAQVTAALKSSARPHPSGTFCTTNQGVCGAGLLDADNALAAAVSAPPAAAAPAPSGGGGGGAVPRWLALALAGTGLLGFALRRRA
ncbi:MprA protease, GlyGly-CTERM protein-sorting domain-containing form [Cupriavidus consociatus]|uniref:MprA protease, GlyGly-CTERM protein-sorting domain-containing form n=1 Tax=Cupriavidus consociatus TaxID=2821357 RepID=UPI001AE75D8F|nr:MULTISPECIES: MprA protease, GlyGly-CTERM protein-sorting domain-containing form [unclassified Cupriavidus]MBP0620289.1 MprA protease, GlyGly-CTERM protein-sorting domain-containing form [Cupriavidus sp. LEh25]MDK2656945.1 MprA protease, GlyGly-CTERM protein-sorting domain-containing form [Cupriavidus sp. LEh21]